MEQAKIIRQALGITREHMGELLGVSLGQYAMAEIGKRKLPPEAAVSMNKLIKVVQQLQAKPADIPKGKKAVVTANTLVRQLSRQLKLKQQAIEVLQDQLLTNQLRLALANKYMEQPFLPDDGIVSMRMKIIQRTALKNQETLLVKLLQLQVEKVSILAQLNYLNNF
jgi:transcriptional regulator with XRE-family HTH domain